MNLDFSNKVVLVTGSSDGIGESIALLFAKLGAKLTLVGRSVDKLQRVARRCEQERGLKPLTIETDLATDLGVEKTVKNTIAHYGRLDILVNNAGVGARTLLENASMEGFDRVFALNVRSVYNLTRLLAPELIKTKGNIINISSVTASMNTPGSLPYGMSKAALDHFSRLISVELAPKGVRVNTVSPGVTVSKFVQRLTGYTDEEYQSWLGDAANKIPLGRVCSGEDIAYAVVYLASDYSSLITGTVLQVDGGVQHVSKFVQRLSGFTDEQYSQWLKTMEAHIPLGRACGAQDIAYAVAHLASDYS